MKQFVLAVMMMTVAGTVLADPPGSGGTTGNGCIENCSDNGGGVPSTNSTGTTTYNNAGGSSNSTSSANAGAIGVGLGVGIAKGGNATGGSVGNVTGNTGTIQGGDGGSIASGAVQNTNTNTSAGGAGGTATTGAITNNNTSAGGSGGSVGNVAGGSVSKDAVNNSNTYSSSYSSNYNEAAQTAYAPSLSSGVDTCMGSSSVGGQGVGFGFSVGTTWNDSNCVRLKNSREMYNMGQKDVALAMMCQNEDVRKAAEAVGSKVCEPAVKPATPKQNDVRSTGPDTSDPFIAARVARNKK